MEDLQHVFGIHADVPCIKFMWCDERQRDLNQVQGWLLIDDVEEGKGWDG